MCVSVNIINHSVPFRFYFRWNGSSLLGPLVEQSQCLTFNGPWRRLKHVFPLSEDASLVFTHCPASAWLVLSWWWRPPAPVPSGRWSDSGSHTPCGTACRISWPSVWYGMLEVRSRPERHAVSPSTSSLASAGGAHLVWVQWSAVPPESQRRPQGVVDKNDISSFIYWPPS